MLRFQSIPQVPAGENQTFFIFFYYLLHGNLRQSHLSKSCLFSTQMCMLPYPPSRAQASQITWYLASLKSRHRAVFFALDGLEHFGYSVPSAMGMHALRNFSRWWEFVFVVLYRQKDVIRLRSSHGKWWFCQVFKRDKKGIFEGMRLTIHIGRPWRRW